MKEGTQKSPLCLSKNMEIGAKLAELAVSTLREDQFLVEVVASSRNLSKITLIVDGDKGITIDDCGQISREMSKKLDEFDFGNNRYVLEVSTPGIDHPLKLKRQFHKNVGRMLKVQKKDKSLLQGRMISSDENRIILKQEAMKGKVLTEGEVILSFEEIEKAFVMVSFK